MTFNFGEKFYKNFDIDEILQEISQKILLELEKDYANGVLRNKYHLLQGNSKNAKIIFENIDIDETVKKFYEILDNLGLEGYEIKFTDSTSVGSSYYIWIEPKKIEKKTN